jgi:hypothetical protein
MKNQDFLYAEIKDEYGDVASCSFCDTLGEVICWFKEHNVDFKEVSFDGWGNYSYRLITVIIQ